MLRVVVVGSGASAVHLAQSVLERGGRVTLLDVGREGPPSLRPDSGFAALKRELDDPAAYFLGPRFEGVLWPGTPGEYYGIPPHKSYVFEGAPRHRLDARGFEPLASFGQGGLAQAWTGGVFPFARGEMEDFAVPFEELLPYYGIVARRIGICGAADDLARFLPLHEHLDDPLDLDLHSAALLERYGERKEELNGRLRCWIGRSRVAVLREDRGERRACGYLGRCLWGCPRDSLYTPLATLRRLREEPGMTYVPGMWVTHVELDGAGRAVRAVAEPIGGGASQTFPGDRIVLAAGTLSSARVFLKTALRAGGRAPELPGLMDNRQVLVPFVNRGLVRRKWDPDTYQYHQLALGLQGEREKEYVHGLITTLKTALIHPIVQRVPLDLRAALSVFRNVHAALGIVNVNFHDTRRPENVLALEPGAGGAPPRLLVRYAPPPDEPRRMRLALRRVRRALSLLGCTVPPHMSYVRPMGASVYYAGTLPMSAARAPLTTSPDGESHDFERLILADGSVLPFLPAKNLTFTLMANAARIAERL
ncbi:MAG TPA: GMC oxidoreductase [Planctomycetota bacterium]|nr:GMC oxidoreductase [Planctomycetota bacterium]